MQAWLDGTWQAPVPFERECCTLSNPTGGAWWNACTTPPDEAITSYGKAGGLEMRTAPWG